ncbi:Cation transport P-ATPase, partial sequence, partial [Candidatus Phytoplasma solani]
MKKKNLKQKETVKFLKKISIQNHQETFQTLGSSWKGLDKNKIILQRNLHGLNLLTKENKNNFLKKIIEMIITPFNLVLIILMVVSLINDVIIPRNTGSKGNYVTIITTFIMFISSFLVQFTQENKYLKITSQLQKLVQNTTAVKRNNQKQEIPLEEVVVGDLILLAAGDIVPA